MTLHILESGLYTLLVDEGRPRSRSLGVPVGGAADRFSLAMGNALVGNPPYAPALEIALAGPTVQSDCNVACVVYGAPFDLACTTGKVRANTTFTLHASDVLHIGGARRGMRAYFCVRGGFQAEPILSSRSAFAPLTPGSELQCHPGAIHRRFILPTFDGESQPKTIRVLPGPQADWFSLSDFLAGERTVSRESNRMGLRLQGESLAVPARELVSEPVCPGAIQVTSNGQCIVLGVDGQTIGGYPKIAQVISADLDKLGQLRPDDRIFFELVTQDEAVALYRRKRAELNEWLTRLRVAEVFVP